MEDKIRNEIKHFVLESRDNLFPGGEPYFEEPLVGFAAADDQLFKDYKQIIGAFHRTPQEILETCCDTGATAATVIVWILPVTTRTCESNRPEKIFPSRAWAQTRCFGEKLNVLIRQHLVAWLKEKGFQAVAPQLASNWQEFPDSPVGIASTWSERHAAYAAGLGTFSLNDALITPRGIAHRCGSVITDLALTPDPRPYPHFRHNCLFYRNGTCGICINRCPVGALSKSGHNKTECRKHVYETIPAAVAQDFGTPQTGCGLCQTGVPCEKRIP